MKHKIILLLKAGFLATVIFNPGFLNLGMGGGTELWADSSALNSDSASSRASSERESAVEPVLSRWHLFGGAAEGYGNVSGSEYSRAPDGPQTLLNVDLSFQTSAWSFELGGGWIYSRLDGVSASQSPISVRTRAGYGDASVRKRFGAHWQLGPAYELEFGADTGFGSSVGSAAATSLLGLRAVYEMNLGQFPFRIIGQGLTSVGDGDRNFVLATLGFQIGLPLGGSENSEQAWVAESPAIVTSSAAPVEPPAEDLRIVLDPRKIFFGTNSSKILPDVRDVLGSIGKEMAAHEDKWERIELRGHADQRGRAGYNLKLSQRRAQSVVAALEEAGASEEKIDAEAFGFSKPADPHNNRTAWGRNRRVEIVVQGVRDPELKARIEELSRYEISGRTP